MVDGGPDGRPNPWFSKPRGKPDPVSDLIALWEELSAQPVRSPSERCVNCWTTFARHAADGRCPDVVPFPLDGLTEEDFR